MPHEEKVSVCLNTSSEHTNTWETLNRKSPT